MRLRGGDTTSQHQMGRGVVFGAIYLLFFSVLSSAGYIFLLRSGCTGGNSLLYLLVSIRGFFVEALITLLLFLLVTRIRKVGAFVGYLLITLFVASNLEQIGSIYYSGSFFPRIAVENIEFIGLFLSPTNLIYAVGLILLFAGVPAVVAIMLHKRLERSLESILGRLTLLCSGVLVILMILFSSNLWLPSSVVENSEVCLAQHGIKRFYPVYALFNTLVGPRKREGKKVVLKGHDIERLRRIFGFQVNPSSPYPLVKDEIYQGECPLSVSSIKRPNVIIIFTEGTSARTLGVYNPKFRKVTPHLNAFAANSTVFLNYFNHTTATYRGLLGQTCSFYPKFGGLGGWHNNYEKLPKTSYFCLTDVFDSNGYQTVFLGAETKVAAHTHDMMRILGFKKVFTAEDLNNRYLHSTFHREWGLSDQQMYQALVGFLRDRLAKENNTPFLLAMYTEGTHAWVDTGPDGIRYGDGKSNTLNTLHNLDDAFGKFWRYYQSSPYARNTIVIFTADHAHFQEKSYVSLMKRMGERDYRPLFVDRVPLILHDPVHRLPPKIDAHGSTSVDLAPTLVHLLCLPNQKSAFVGLSLFSLMESGRWPKGITAYEGKRFVIDEKGIHGSWSLEREYKDELKLARRFIKFLHQLDVDDRIWPVKHPERWGDDYVKSKIALALQSLSSKETSSKLLWPHDGTTLNYAGFKGLPGLILFAWKGAPEASYKLHISLEAQNGTATMRVMTLNRDDGNLVVLDKGGIVGTYYLFSQQDVWNSFAGCKVRWWVEALDRKGKPLWKTEERSFGFNRTKGER